MVTFQALCPALQKLTWRSIDQKILYPYCIMNLTQYIVFWPHVFYPMSRAPSLWVIIVVLVNLCYALRDVYMVFDITFTLYMYSSFNLYCNTRSSYKPLPRAFPRESGSQLNWTVSVLCPVHGEHNLKKFFSLSISVRLNHDIRRLVLTLLYNNHYRE